jgi:hypothetical protein
MLKFEEIITMYIAYCIKYLEALMENVIFLFEEDELTDAKAYELEVCFTVIKDSLEKLNKNRV